MTKMNRAFQDGLIRAKFNLLVRTDRPEDSDNVPGLDRNYYNNRNKFQILVPIQ